MPIMIIYFFEFINIQNNKSTFFMRPLLQDFVDECLCRAFVENTCQTVCLCIVTQLFIADTIVVDNLENK